MTTIEAVEVLKQGQPVKHKRFTICRDPLTETRFAVYERGYPNVYVTCSDPENAIRFVNRGNTGDYATPMAQIKIKFEPV
mgnify:CR=1 FL=1